VAVGVYAWVAAALHPFTLGEETLLFASPDMRFRTDYRMPALLMGCVAAIALANGSRLIRRIPRPEITIPVLALLFVACELLPKPWRYVPQAPIVPIMLLSTYMATRTLLARKKTRAASTPRKVRTTDTGAGNLP